MLRSTFSRFGAGPIVFVLVAMLSAMSAAAEEKGSALKTPNTFKPHGKSTEQAIHTDLGMMGEVEIVRERYPDGGLKIERQTTLDGDGNYVNHGSWKMFSTKGDVLAEGQYHFGQRVGLWTRWHDKNNAKILDEFPYNQFKAPFMSQVTFTDGQMDGEWLITDANDRKCSQISLKDGERNGVAITWLPNGKTYRQATYENGRPVGDLLEADKQSGELKRAATYVDGRKLITRVGYYQNNKKQKKSETIYLSPETIENARDQFWSMKMATYTTEGKELRHGSSKTWYPDGKQEFEGFYQNGLKSGLFTFWYQNGQVASTGEYSDDKPTGQWVWWHENGQKSSVGQYQNGRLIGEWRWWDDAGKLTKQHVYDGSESVTSQSDATLKVGNASGESTVR